MSTTLAPDSQLKDLGYQPSLNRQLPFGSLLVYGLLFRPDGPGGRLWAGG